jgi:hypothetical protein
LFHLHNWRGSDARSDIAIRFKLLNLFGGLGRLGRGRNGYIILVVVTLVLFLRHDPGALGGVSFILSGPSKGLHEVVFVDDAQRFALIIFCVHFDLRSHFNNNQKSNKSFCSR